MIDRERASREREAGEHGHGHAGHGNPGWAPVGRRTQPAGPTRPRPSLLQAFLAQGGTRPPRLQRWQGTPG